MDSRSPALCLYKKGKVRLVRWPSRWRYPDVKSDDPAEKQCPEEGSPLTSVLQPRYAGAHTQNKIKSADGGLESRGMEECEDRAEAEFGTRKVLGTP